MSLLEIDLTAGYGKSAPVLRGLRLAIAEGESFGLVGESGAGKSTVALAILNLLGWKGGWVRGEICFEGRNLMGLGEPAWRRVRGRRIAAVPQSPLDSLNPALRIGRHFEECWRAHARGKPPALELLESVALPAEESFLRRYPGELSVGQAQRVAIALALLHRPALILADEPTSALDPLTQAGILELFAKVNREGTAILYVSHDLLSVGSLCSRIGILREGEIVESGPCAEIFAEPAHGYTRRLLAAIPKAAGLTFRPA